jgi:hypothetical protein
VESTEDAFAHGQAAQRCGSAAGRATHRSRQPTVGRHAKTVTVPPA